MNNKEMNSNSITVKMSRSFCFISYIWRTRIYYELFFISEQIYYRESLFAFMLVAFESIGENKHTEMFFSGLKKG